MAGLAPEGSQFDTRQYDCKMNDLLSVDGQDFFTSYDEVYDSFDAMGLHENLLRGIYAYESKASLRNFDVSGACEDVEMLPKLSASVAVVGDQRPIDPEYISEQRTLANKFEDPKDLEDLEWKLIYVGSAEDETYDQLLESVLVGPVNVGNY